MSEKATGFHELSKKYGDVFGLWMGPNRSIVVSGFAKVQEVGARWIHTIFRLLSMKYLNLFREEFQDRYFIENVKDLRGGPVRDGFPGLLSSSGRTWMEQRRFTLGYMTTHFWSAKNIINE